jgi:nucleoside-diphosphate-sugar epimerase
MIVRCLVTGQPVPLPADGRPAVNPIYIDDAVGFTQAAASLTGMHCLNVAGDEAVDQRTLVARLADALHCSWREQPLPATEKDCVADMAFALGVTGYRYTVSLDEGLARSVASGDVPDSDDGERKSAVARYADH